MDLDALDMILESYPEFKDSLGYDEVASTFNSMYNGALIGVCDNFMDPKLLYSEVVLKKLDLGVDVPGLILHHENMTVKEFYDLAEKHDGIMIADGFDDCIIGVVFNARSTSNANAVYSSNKCIEQLIKDIATEDDEEESHTTALEYFTYNVSGSYMGSNTPLFLTEFE